MHLFIITCLLITISASLALGNSADFQDTAILERNSALENSASNNVLRRCLDGCSAETPACPTCRAGFECMLTPPSCDACASTVCIRAPDPPDPSPSSDISPIKTTTSAPVHGTLNTPGASAISAAARAQLTGLPTIAAIAGLAVCFL